jgi:hypothetical protein
MYSRGKCIQMHSEIDKLAALLAEAAAVLRTYRETQWAESLTRDAGRIRALDLSGIEHFLSAWGSMGSLGDVYLCPANGHPIDPQAVEPVNDTLRALLSESYRLAMKLHREEMAARSKP